MVSLIKCEFDNSACIHCVLRMYFSAIKSWSGSAVDTAIQKVCNYLCMYRYVCLNSLLIACTVKSVSTVDAAVQANYLTVVEGSF